MLAKVRRACDGHNPRLGTATRTLRGTVERVDGAVLELARSHALFPADDVLPPLGADGAVSAPGLAVPNPAVTAGYCLPYPFLVPGGAAAAAAGLGRSTTVVSLSLALRSLNEVRMLPAGAPGALAPSEAVETRGLNVSSVIRGSSFTVSLSPS